MTDAPLLHTPLHPLHVRLGARMVPFAGYAMPVQYPVGLVAEHRHCRGSAALFDVSHMGQVRLVGEGAAAALETLVPVDLIGLGVGRQRYAFFTNATGGLLDDLMVVRPDAVTVYVGPEPPENRRWFSELVVGKACETLPGLFRVAP